MFRTLFENTKDHLKETRNDIFFSLLILFVLVCLSLVSKLLFHTVAELFSILVGWAIFLITWNARKFIQNDFLKFLGIAFFWIACFDFVHLVTYKGMNIIPGVVEANIPTQFWIIARYLQAASLLFALFTPFYRKKTAYIFLIYGMICLAFTVLIFSGWFPTCYIDGAGLTQFKIFSEYVIVLLFITAAWFIGRGQNPDFMFYKRWVVISIIFSVIAEIFFTQYVGIFDFANLAGHYFKCLAFFALYRGVVETGLKNPMLVLVNNLDQKNKEVETETVRRKQSEAENYFLATLQKNISDAVISTDLEDKITFWNQAAEKMFGWKQESVLGKNIFELLKTKPVNSTFEEIKNTLEHSGSWEGELEEEARFGTKLIVQTKTSRLFSADGEMLGMVGVARDVTKEKKEQDRVKIRLMLGERINHMTETELIRLGLNEAVRFCECEYGYFHFFNQTKQEISLTVWSDKVYEVCNVNERGGFSLSECGIWADSLRSLEPVIHNDYQSEKKRVGLPLGHIPITRDISVPVIDHQSVPQAIIGMGNKKFYYDTHDAEILQKFARDMWMIINEKRILVALANSEKRFRKYFELPLVGVAIVDAEFNWIDVNDYLITALGHSRDSFFRNNFKQLFPKFPFDAWNLNYSPLLNIETQIYHRDGSLVDVEISAQVIFDEIDTPDYFLMQIKDISDWKTTQKNTQIQLNRLSKLEILHFPVRTQPDLEKLGGLVLEILKDELTIDAAFLMINQADFPLGGFIAQFGFEHREHEIYQILNEVLQPLHEKIKKTTNWLTADMEQIFSPDQVLMINGQEKPMISYIGIPLKRGMEILGWISLFSTVQSQGGTDTTEFLSAMVDHLVLMLDDYLNFSELSQQNRYYKKAYDETISAWANTGMLTNKFFNQYPKRELELMLLFAKKLMFSEGKIDSMQKGVFLHDIGYYGIESSIILKTDVLNDWEKKQIRQHPIFALKILSSVEALKPALDIPVYHHEQWDGSGYPYGLSGENIPLLARMFALVDVWDALLSDRPYRPAWKEEDALAFIQQQAGKHFDPKLVPVFLEIIQK